MTMIYSPQFSRQRKDAGQALPSQNPSELGEDESQTEPLPSTPQPTNNWVEVNPNAIGGAAIGGMRRARRESENDRSFRALKYDPLTYIREKLGWEPWGGTDETPGQVEVIEAYRMALLQMKERDDWQNGKLATEDLQYWELGTPVKNYLRIQAGHTIGKCIAWNELITLSNGSRATAMSLCGTSFELLTLVNGKPTPVQASAEFNAYEVVYELVTDSGKRVVRNAEHPFFTGKKVYRTRVKATGHTRCSIEPDGFTSLASIVGGDLVAVAESLPAWDVLELPEHSLEMLAIHSKDKRIPECVWRLCPSQLAQFLNLLWVTDDGFCSASLGLVQDVQYALQKLGIHSSFNRILGTVGWELTISDAVEQMKFIEIVRGDRQRHGDHDTGTEQDSTVRQWFHRGAPEGTRWETVVSVKEMPATMTVAIEVPEHRTFLTQFYEHNTILASGLFSHFFDCFGPAIIYTFAPSAQQIKDLLWKEIGTWRLKNKLPGRLLENCELKMLQKNWFAKGRATDDAHGKGSEKVHGQHGQNLMFILDEAEGVPTYVFEAIDSMASGGTVIVILLANPKTRTSDFHKIRVRPTVWNCKISCLYHPNVIAGREVVPNAVRREYIETMIGTHCQVVNAHISDEGTFTLPFDVPFEGGVHQSGVIFLPDFEFSFRVLGEAPANNSDNTFVPVGRYEAARKRAPVDDRPEMARLGVDVARFGNDFGTIYVRWNGRVWRAGYMAKQDSTEYFQTILKFAHELHAEGVTDFGVRVDGGGGFGGGLVDLLKRSDELKQLFEVFQVWEVHNNGTPKDTNAFKNLGTEMYAQAAESLKGLALIRPPDALEEDLCERTFDWVNVKGRDVKVLTDKAEFKKKHENRSPDDGDGFCLAVAPDFIFSLGALSSPPVSHRAPVLGVVEATVATNGHVRPINDALEHRQNKQGLIVPPVRTTVQKRRW